MYEGSPSATAPVPAATGQSGKWAAAMSDARSGVGVVVLGRRAIDEQGNDNEDDDTERGQPRPPLDAAHNRVSTGPVFTSLRAVASSVGPMPNDGHHRASPHAPHAGLRA